jgi:hypothetical protein
MERTYGREVVELREESSGTFRVGEDKVVSMQEIEESVGDNSYAYIEVKFLDGTARQYNVGKLTWFTYKE